MSRWLRRIVDAEPGELAPASLAGLQFFCLLFGYFLLRPLREALGLEGGIDSLRLLFLATVAVMIAANVVYGFVAARLPRGVLVPLVYLGALASLIVFALFLGNAGQTVGAVFYVWLSVFNLFAVSVFWSLCADVFTLEQGKRLFGFIGVGGTAGALLGSGVAWGWAERFGSAGILWIAAALIGLTAAISFLLSRWAARGGSRGEPVGGLPWAGLTELFRSRYLGAIGATVLIFSVCSTLLYFEKMRIVEAAVEGTEARASVFAAIETASQTLTILLQVFLTGRLMRWLGVGAMLAVVPLITMLGFTALGLLPTLALVTVFEATRRAGNFALSKPARETLFTVVPREDKYKAKSAIDTFVYRGGDTLGTLADKAVAIVALPAAVLAVPLAVAGVALAAWLGREEKRLSNQTGTEPEIQAERKTHVAVTP
jgi:AAA family ATP:ADP antiporter